MLIYSPLEPLKQVRPTPHTQDKALHAYRELAPEGLSHSMDGKDINAILSTNNRYAMLLDTLIEYHEYLRELARLRQELRKLKLDEHMGKEIEPGIITDFENEIEAVIELLEQPAARMRSWGVSTWTLEDWETTDATGD